MTGEEAGCEDASRQHKGVRVEGEEIEREEKA